MIKYPKIIISYNRFLDPIFIGYIQAQPQWKDWIVPQRSLVDANIKMYRETWDTFGPKALEAICKRTGFFFMRNQIDVHVVSGNPRSFSRPIIIKSRYTNVEFINTVIHELIHCLFSDNEKTPGFSPKYPHVDEITSSHVIVYALLKYIFLDTIERPDMILAPTADGSPTNAGYLTAWNIVEKDGYMKILTEYFPN